MGMTEPTFPNDPFTINYLISRSYNGDGTASIELIRLFVKHRPTDGILYDYIRQSLHDITEGVDPRMALLLHKVGKKKAIQRIDRDLSIAICIKEKLLKHGEQNFGLILRDAQPCIDKIFNETDPPSDKRLRNIWDEYKNHEYVAWIGSSNYNDLVQEWSKKLESELLPER